MSGVATGGAEVLVVGGGVAGIAATQALLRAGVRVSLLETEARLGGRVAAGHGADPLGWQCGARDTALSQVLGSLGSDQDWVKPVLRLARGGGLMALQSDRPELRQLGFDAWRFPRFERLLAHYRPLLDVEHPETAAVLDDRSLEDFARLYLGRRALAAWIEPWLAARAPVDEREVSRVGFLLQWQRRAGADPAVSTRALSSRLSAAIPAASVRALRVAHIKNRPNGALEVTGVRADGAIRLEARAVVLAVPPRIACRVAEPCLTPSERAALARWTSHAGALWSAPVDELPASLRGLATRSGGVRVWVPRAVSGWVASVTLRRVERELWLGALLRRGAADADPEQLARVLPGELSRWLPGLRLRVAESLWHAEPEAFPHFAVGTYRCIARLRRVAASERARGRRLYLAGDYWIESSLEGAARSGLRAAEEVLADRASTAPASP